MIDGLEKYRHSDKQEIWPFVRDTTGLLVGRITDYAIDRKTMEVLAIEYIQGYWPRERISRIWVYDYSPAKDSEEFVVPDVLRGKPIFSREGEKTCEYRP